MENSSENVTSKFGAIENNFESAIGNLSEIERDMVGRLA